MLEVVKSQKVKEIEIKEVKKESFSISPKMVKRILLTGVVAELLALGNAGYNFYTSGIGMRLNLPYCNNMVIPYWFLALAIASPIIPKIVNKSFKFIVKTTDADTRDLNKLWEKHYGDK